MPSEYVRLTETFLAALARSPRPLKRDPFVSYFRDIKRWQGEIEKDYRHLRAGDPVKRIYAVALVEYARDYLGVEEFPEERAFFDTLDRSDHGVWDTPFDVMRALTDQLSDSPEMYVRDPVGDMLAAARMQMYTFGVKSAKHGDLLDVESCVGRGETGMSRTQGEFARWLRDIARRDGLYRSVMFFVSGRERLGMTVVLPLSRDAWERMACGNLNDRDLTAADFQASSRFLFVHSMSDAEQFDAKAHERTLAQARTIYYQMAYFCRGEKPLRPALLSLITNAYYEALFASHGWRKNGSLMKDTEYPLVEFRHPADGGRMSRESYIRYQVWVTILRLYRFIHRAKWREEDAQLGL